MFNAFKKADASNEAITVSAFRCRRCSFTYESVKKGAFAFSSAKQICASARRMNPENAINLCQQLARKALRYSCFFLLILTTLGKARRKFVIILVGEKTHPAKDKLEENREELLCFQSLPEKTPCVQKFIFSRSLSGENEERKLP